MKTHFTHIIITTKWSTRIKITEGWVELDIRLGPSVIYGVYYYML